MKKKNRKKSGVEQLEFIRPKETTRIIRAREGKAAGVIKKLRVWLPALSVGVLATLFWWPSLLPGFTLSNVRKNIPDLVIDNVHYTGVDNKNQAYSIMASQATKPADLSGVYDMTNPEGEITLQGGTWIDSRADFGRYDETVKQLWLGGNVKVFHNKGYQMTTEEMRVSLDTNDAWGEKGILIQGGFGTIKGTGFRFLESGNKIVIEGPAAAVFTLRDR